MDPEDNQKTLIRQLAQVIIQQNKTQHNPPPQTYSQKNRKDFRHECERQNLYFSGIDSDRLDVFLLKISRVRKMIEISDRDLIAIFPSLFRNAGNVWYENNIAEDTRQATTGVRYNYY